jgi:hypothetical protein
LWFPISTVWARPWWATICEPAAGGSYLAESFAGSATR